MKIAIFHFSFAVILLVATGPIFPQNKFAQIEWEKDDRSEKYLLQISKDKNFFEIVHEQITKENSIHLPLNDKITENLFGRVAGIGKYEILGIFSKPFLIKVMMTEKSPPPPVEEKKEVKEEKKLDVYFNDNRPFVSNRIGFSLQTGDNGSGIGTTFYKLNDGNWQKYDGTFYFPKEGRNIIAYYSVDLSGNKEPVKEAEFYLDTTPPKISILPKNIFHRNGFFYSGKNSSFQISALDEGTDVKSLEYSFNADGQNENKFFPVKESELAIPENYSNKKISLFVRAIDNLGNTSEKQFFFHHDMEPPQIETDIPAGKEYFKLGAKIKITAIDFQSGLKWIKFSLNGKPEEFYADSIEFLEPGKQRINIVAEDNSGNISTKEITSVQVLAPKNFNIKVKMP